MQQSLFESAGSAEFSVDGRYRWRLERHWDHARPVMTFVMLNPSTADGRQDDPTVRRCLGFARREGCGGIVVVNLFAWRATDPADLCAAAAAGDDVIGPENHRYVHNALEATWLGGGVVVAAWGAHVARPVLRPFLTPPVKAGPERPVWTLGVTKAGFPRHPLMVRADQPLQHHTGRVA